MKKKLFCLLITVLTFVILPGCWDYMEYENMAIIGAIGVDYDAQSDEFTISLQKLSANKAGAENEGQSRPQVNLVGAVHSLNCKTIYEGMAEFQTVISNKLFFGYTDILMIGENAAKYKLKEIIDLTDRTPSMRAKTQIVIVKNAVDSLSTVDYSKTKPSSFEISNLLKQSKNSGVSCDMSVQNFEEMLAIGGLEAVAPYIVTSSNEVTEAKGGVVGKIHTYQERVGNQILSGTAVFKGEQFVGCLDAKESQGYIWITGQKIHEYKVSESTDNENNQDSAYYFIRKAKSSVDIKLENDTPSFNIKVNITAELRKNLNNTESNIILPAELAKLETMLNESIQSDIEAALQKCQKEYKTDVFGFGFTLFRKSPAQWNNKYEKEWDKIYPELPVNIEISSTINSTGTNIRKFIIK